MPIGSRNHRADGIQANHALTFKLDHSGGADHFNGTLRRIVLNAEWFKTTKQSQIVINQWLGQCNKTRPHQALNTRPPLPGTLIRNGTELEG
jgi:hypothetical protein